MYICDRFACKIFIVSIAIYFDVGRTILKIMTEFEKLVKKTAMELSSNQYHLLTVVRDEHDSEIAAIFYKNDSPIIYFVSVVDFDRILPDKYKKSIDETIHDMLKLNEGGFINAICIHFISGKDTDELRNFVNSQDVIYDGNIHNVWWYADFRIKKVCTGDRQPSKVNDIGKILNRALEDEKTDIRMSVEKLSEAGANKSQLIQVAKFPLLVFILIVLNLILFGLEVYSGDIQRYIYNFGVNKVLIFLDGQLYRLFTHIFMHGSVEHVFLNCMSLYIYGSKVEKYYGRFRTFAIYCVSGILGGLVSALFNTGFSVGASGAIFGMIGALLSICKKTGKQIDGLGYMTMAVLAVISIGMGFLNPQVDNFGHIGGLIGGFIMGMMLYRDKEE